MSASDPTQSREVQLGQLFVRLADNLVQDFDLADLLHDLVGRCVGLLDADAAGLMLTDQQGRLRLVAASSEQTRLLELFELQNEQGPCLDCFHSGKSISAISPEEQSELWPRVAPVLRSLGFHAAYAFPMRLRNQTIGALNVFCRSGLPATDQQIVQALADVATISILQQRTTEAGERLVNQLQNALDSRVVIEQAKGVIAQHAGVDVNRAFAMIRGYARDRRQSLTAVATALVSGELPPAVVVPASEHEPSSGPGVG